MTLDEAIKHANEVAEENQAIVDSCDYYGENMAKCEECAKEHRQLATWLKELKQLREQMSSSEEPNKWILTSERLPEKDVEVLATTEWGTITIAERCSKNEWFIYEGDATANADEIKAWMPLPEPYKAESEE